MGSIRNTDLGVVTKLSPYSVIHSKELMSPGTVGSYNQNLHAERTSYILRGYFDAPTQLQLDGLRSLKDGEVGLLDLSTELGLYEWVKVRGLALDYDEKKGSMVDYRLDIKSIPCVGTVEALTTGGPIAGLHDLNYYRAVKSFDPFRGRYNVTLASALLHQQEFYLANWGTIGTLEFDIWCGNDLQDIEVWCWKNSAWDSLDDWGTAAEHAWGATHAWTDEDAVAHVVRFDFDERGAAPANFTEKVPRSIGTYFRVMGQISLMQTYVGASALSTTYGGQQVLFKVLLTHTQRETIRPYPIVTYVDGGLGYGVA